MPETRPFMEMKIAHSTGLNNKRVMTSYDESWIDSFDPVLPKQSIVSKSNLQTSKELRTKSLEYWTTCLG